MNVYFERITFFSSYKSFIRKLPKTSEKTAFGNSIAVGHGKTNSWPTSSVSLIAVFSVTSANFSRSITAIDKEFNILYRQVHPLTLPKKKQIPCL